MTDRTLRLVERPLVHVPLAAAAAVLYGALCAVAPQLAFGVLGLAALVVLVLRFPVAHLALLVAITAIVPFEVQQRFGIGGGIGAAGLLPSDALLMAGLARSLLVLTARRLDRWQVGIALGTVAVLAWVSLAFARGVLLGHPLSPAGAEYRVLLGFGTALVALPLLSDPRHRERLLVALAWVGLALGLAGLMQWFGGFRFADAGDFGVREGVALTSAGTGQLQGGLYGYPVAIIMAFAAIISGTLRRPGARALVWAVLVTNALGCLLTYERTFWVMTVLCCGVVALRAGRAERARALIGAPLAAVLLAVVLATVAPGALTTARERLLSIGQYGRDNSVAYRVLESQYVLDAVRARPVVGSGLGATIYWGRPLERVPARIYYFSHNGFLWVTWKLGLVGTVLLFGLIGAAIARPGRARGTPLFAAVTGGAAGALLCLLLVNVTFPSVSQLPATPTLGLLIAFAAAPRVPHG